MSACSYGRDERLHISACAPMLVSHYSPSKDSLYVGFGPVRQATCSSLQMTQDRNHSLESTHRSALRSHAAPFLEMPLTYSVNSTPAFPTSRPSWNSHKCGHVLPLRSHVSHLLHLAPGMPLLLL